MKAAIIGGGFAANMHASALRSCGIELAAVVTSRPEAARSFADQWHVPRFGTDLHLALDSEIDAVHICTPPTFHAEHIRAALRAGKRVLCEKPLCFDTRQAQELAALAEAAGQKPEPAALKAAPGLTAGPASSAESAGPGQTLCAVDYNVRYHMAVQKARRLIAGGAFGRVLLIHGSYQQEFHILPCPYDWRYDPALSGGMRAVTEIGSHWIDTAQYVSGKKVQAVSALFGSFSPDRIVRGGIMEKAQTESPAPEDGSLSAHEGSSLHPADGDRIRVDSEDAACILLRFEDGVIGTVFLSEITPGRGNRLALEITCENGSLWWNEEENNILHTAVRGEGVRSEIFAFGNGFQDTVVSLTRSFYEGGEVPTFREAEQVARVCAAAGKSSRLGSSWIDV